MLFGYADGGETLARRDQPLQPGDAKATFDRFLPGVEQFGRSKSNGFGPGVVFFRPIDFHAKSKYAPHLDAEQACRERHGDCSAH